MKRRDEMMGEEMKRRDIAIVYENYLREIACFIH